MADRSSLLLPISIVGIGAALYLFKDEEKGDDDGVKFKGPTIAEAEGASVARAERLFKIATGDEPDVEPSFIQKAGPREIALSADGESIEKGGSWDIAVLDAFLEKRRQNGLLATKQDSERTWWEETFVDGPSTFLGKLFSGWFIEDEETQEIVGDVIYGFLWTALNIGIGGKVFRNVVKNPARVVPVKAITEKSNIPTTVSSWTVTNSGIVVPSNTPVAIGGVLNFKVPYQAFKSVERAPYWQSYAKDLGKNWPGSFDAGAFDLKYYFYYLFDQSASFGKDSVAKLANAKGVGSVAALATGGYMLAAESPNIAASALDSAQAFMSSHKVKFGKGEAYISELPPTPTVLELNKYIQKYTLDFQKRVF